MLLNRQDSVIRIAQSSNKASESIVSVAPTTAKHLKAKANAFESCTLFAFHQTD